MPRSAFGLTCEEVEEPPPHPASRSDPNTSRQIKPGAERRARIRAMFSER